MFCNAHPPQYDDIDTKEKTLPVLLSHWGNKKALGGCAH